MDLQLLREEALKFKKKAQKVWSQVISVSAEKLAASKYTLTSKDDINTCIAKSQITTGVDSKTGKPKDFKHRVVIIFVDITSDYFKTLLYKLPVLITKAYSQSIVLRLADISIKGLDTKAYKISWQETMVVFEDKKVIKSLEWQENIQKVVKSLSLDINRTIDSL